MLHFFALCMDLFCQVVVVLQSSRKDKYDNIKKYLCVDFPIPSQCVLARTLSRPQALLTVATKIALQIVCKIGGELWTVEIPVRQGLDSIDSVFTYSIIFICIFTYFTNWL